MLQINVIFRAVVRKNSLRDLRYVKAETLSQNSSYLSSKYQI